MKHTTALKTSLKYHLLALVPTLLGGGLAAVGIWFGVIDPSLAALSEVETKALLTGSFIHDAELNPLLGSTSAVLGYLVHRIGRTAILLKLHGNAVESTIADQVTASQPSHPTTASPPLSPSLDGSDTDETPPEEEETTHEPTSDNTQSENQTADEDSGPDELSALEIIESIQEDRNTDGDRTDESDTS